MSDLTIKTPTFLADRAKKYYSTLLEYVEGSSGGRAVDVYQLAILANAFLSYQDAVKTIQDEGGYYNTSGGLKRLHPANNIMNESLKVINQLGMNFGLNPKSRELMLKSWRAGEQPDALDKLLGE